MSMKSKNRLFVLCNDKLKNDPVYACVQGGHAVAQYMIDNADAYNEYWKNSTIVYLWYKERNFNDWNMTGWPLGHQYFRDLRISTWNEPDQDNIMTSAAVWENDILDHEYGQPIMRMIDKMKLVK